MYFLPSVSDALAFGSGLERSLAHRRCPVLVIAGTLWFRRSLGCSVVMFPVSAPRQDRSGERALRQSLVGSERH